MYYLTINEFGDSRLYTVFKPEFKSEVEDGYLTVFRISFDSRAIWELDRLGEWQLLGATE